MAASHANYSTNSNWQTFLSFVVYPPFHYFIDVLGFVEVRSVFSLHHIVSCNKFISYFLGQCGSHIGGLLIDSCALEIRFRSRLQFTDEIMTGECVSFSQQLRRMRRGNFVVAGHVLLTVGAHLPGNAQKNPTTNCHRQKHSSTPRCVHTSAKLMEPEPFLSIDIKSASICSSVNFSWAWDRHNVIQANRNSSKFNNLFPTSPPKSQPSALAKCAHIIEAKNR